VLLLRWLPVPCERAAFLLPILGVTTNMALRPPTACRHPGCPEITRHRSGYCKLHRIEQCKRWRREQEANRPSASKRGYGKDWQRLRNWFIQRHPVCEICKKEGRLTPAEVVHHIKSVKERPDLRLEQENLQALCFDCHEKVHGRK